MRMTSSQMRSVIRGVVRQRFGLITEGESRAEDDSVSVVIDYTKGRGLFDYIKSVSIENKSDDPITYLTVDTIHRAGKPRGPEFIIKGGKPQSLGRGVFDITKIAFPGQTWKDFPGPEDTATVYDTNTVIGYRTQSGKKGILTFTNEKLLISADLAAYDVTVPGLVPPAPSPEAGSTPPTPPTTTTTTPPEPQASAGSVQEKAAQGQRIISGQFKEVEDEISCDVVRSQSPAPAGQAWITSEEAGAYGLKNWDSALGDPYRYCALVVADTKEPLGFVVTRDPRVGISSHDTRASIGYFLCPEAREQRHRDAFCYMYKRATGRTHPTCPSGKGGSGVVRPAAPTPAPGPREERPGGGGTIPGRETYGPGENSALGTPGAVKLSMGDGAPRRGSGDAIRGVLNIGIRPGEKLRAAGTKIITKSKDNQGFRSFPQGPGRMFYRNPVFATGGMIPPSSLGVFFRNPMGIVTDEADLNPFIKFGANDGPEDIRLIRLGWGAVGRIGGRGAFFRGLTLRPGDVGFEEAALWVYAHQEEFDLRPDGFVIEDPMDVSQDISHVERVGGLMESRIVVNFDRFLR